MAAGSSNPLRQQMINMMYLVLTALLALNVSAEILTAFQVVNEGMDQSIAIISEKNNSSNEHLDKLYAKTPQALEELHAKATAVNKTCNELFDYIQKMKDDIIEQTGGIDEHTGEMEGMKNFEITTRIMVNEGRGEVLMKKMGEAHIDLKKIMEGVSGIGDLNEFEKNNILVEEEKPKNPQTTWAEETFHMVPGIATITLLTSMQTNIKNTQANLIDALVNSIGAEEVSFDKFIPVVNVITGKSSVSIGEAFKAEILLAAYDSKQQSEIYLGGNKLEVKDGKALFVGNTASQGSHNMKGKIVVKNKKTGESKDYEFLLAYDVFQSAAIISATKMNVLYVGLENPIDVSVPGYKPSDVSASVSGAGSLRMKSAGKYIYKISKHPGRNSKIKINASVRTEGGARGIGSKVFRIKNVPKPIALFGSKADGMISRAEIRLVKNIIARLENFVFEGLQYKIVKYKFIFKPKRGEAQIATVKGSRLSAQVLGYIANPQRGDMIIVTNIYARAPGVGQKRLQGGIVLTVK